jgi:hypothetical protein
MEGSMMIRLALLLLALLLPMQLDAQLTTPAAITTQVPSGVSVLQSSVSVLILSFSFLLHLYC